MQSNNTRAFAWHICVLEHIEILIVLRLGFFFFVGLMAMFTACPRKKKEFDNGLGSDELNSLTDLFREAEYKDRLFCILFFFRDSHKNELYFYYNLY